jgi:Spy/CpxP family protein refolding chaperone
MKWHVLCFTLDQYKIQRRRSSMKKAVIGLGMVVVLLVGFSFVYARGPGYGAGWGPGNGPGNCAGRGQGNGPGNCAGLGAANLSADQQAQLKALREKHFEEASPLRQQMFSLRQELRTLWSDPKADSAAIEAKSLEMGKLRDEMQAKMVKFRLEARNVLTPDQISALSQGCGRGGRGGRGAGGCGQAGGCF